MRKIKDIVAEKPWVGWAIFLGTLIIVFLIGLFGASIIERRGEAQLQFQLVKPIAEWEPRNEVWGESFPRQFESYLDTRDTTFRSIFGGGALIDMLDKYPNLVILWAGFAFSRDYKQGRGHYYSIEAVRNSLRIGVPQPATCWTCKSTDVPRLMNEMGVAEFYKADVMSLGSEVVNHIGCQDCHDPQTMNLRITRPALIEAFERQGKDITKATNQEMRSLVCAQCHVEYYFKGKDEKYLTFPWDHGITAEDMEYYFDNIEHVDFVHSLSKAKIIKAQHPDWELAQFGIHAQRGLSCADCHMPYKSEGGVKFSNHKMQSPLNNIENACQPCHRESEETLRNNVYERQLKVRELANLCEISLVNAHIEAKTAWDNGAAEEQMKEVLSLIRKAQWRWDYVVASHGGSFHAPLESARLLGTAIQLSEKSRILLASILTKLGVKYPVDMPDISTKAKAQQYIRLDMDKLRSDKKEFLKTVVPEWDKQAAERQSKMNY